MHDREWFSPAPGIGQHDEEAAVDGVQAAEVRRRLQRRDEAVPARGGSGSALSLRRCAIMGEIDRIAPRPEGREQVCGTTAGLLSVTLRARIPQAVCQQTQRTR